MNLQNKRIWKVITHPDFSKYCKPLSGKGKWLVAKHLVAMAHMKDPTIRYKNSVCGRPDILLIGLLDDGGGNMELEMQIRVYKDKQELRPIGVWPLE